MAQTDREALVALYNATGGPRWKRNRHWDTDADLSQWHGIETNDQGRVVGLDLFSNNLRGAIPAQFSALDKLVRLDLSFNQLSGNIPPELGKLTALTTLNLLKNKLTGPIPDTLGDLTKLEELILSHNQLTGYIPPELGALSKLDVLRLNDNKLTGPIPQELEELQQLRNLWLSNNQLTGAIPSQFGALDKLVKLDLSFNQLSGLIPPELGNLAALQSLHLENNQLRGPIPPELGNLAALQFLHLEENELSGLIPPELGGLGKLKELLLYNNTVFGPIPDVLVGDLSKPVSLRLGDNELTGQAEGNVNEKYGAGLQARARGRQPRRSHIGNRWAYTRGDSGSGHGSDRGSTRGSSAGSEHGSNHGLYDYSAVSEGSNTLRDYVDDTGKPDRLRGAGDRVGEEGRSAPGGIFSPHDAAESPNEHREHENTRGGSVKNGFASTILEDLDIKDAPHVSEGGGVRLSIPSQSPGSRIGPITVEEAVEAVDGNDDTVLVLMQVVHCLPDFRRFEQPLTLDFAVRDGRVWWWNRAAVREQVLREYQILFKQSEDDLWQEMRPEDVSVVWDGQGSTCLRARVEHFTWFGSAKRTAKASAISVSRYWDNTVLVANATDLVAHVTPMPISFNTGEEATKVCSLTFWEVGINFEAGKKVERIMLPAGTSSEIIPAGGMAELFLSGGAKEMKIIICFLPERKDAAVPVPSTQAGSLPPGAPPTPRAIASPVNATSIGTSTRQGTTWDPQTPGATAPSSGDLRPLGRGALTRAPSPVTPQSAAGEKSPTESEEMVYSVTKVISGRRKLTLMQALVNRKIKIEKNARALETYAMMLADVGKPPP